MVTQLELPKGFAIGDNVAVQFGDSYKFYQVLNRDNIQYLDDTSSSISSGGTESFSERSKLDPPTNQMLQIFRLEILHNVKVQMKQPASTNRWGTEKSPEGGYLTDKNDFTPLNIFVLEDYPPNIQVVNDTPVALTPKFRWHGWRYLLKPIDKPSVFTIVPALGLSR